MGQIFLKSPCAKLSSNNTLDHRSSRIQHDTLDAHLNNLTLNIHTAYCHAYPIYFPRYATALQMFVGVRQRHINIETKCWATWCVWLCLVWQVFTARKRRGIPELGKYYKKLGVKSDSKSVVFVDITPSLAAEPLPSHSMQLQFKMLWFWDF